MTTNRMTFPVERGMEGMNKLALFLNAAISSDNWHFAKGSRFDQTMVDICFDDPHNTGMARRCREAYGR